ncbi:MAG: hypothetical protein R3350_04700, partial [Saprospiraceae bacterium]|nr:hypothetical protein [Saprospiraceae bacterium]
YCIAIFILSLLFVACGDKNPPAEGFNKEGSDPEAIAIADDVMEAMGGRKAWDDTRYIRWNFFGRRYLLWDKKTGDVRIDIPYDSLVILTNVHDPSQGKARRKTGRIQHPDTLNAYLQRGRSIWINDAYWLVMPFKLKDSGVTLTYVGEGNSELGVPSDILELTFEEVGDTPQNKYRVYVSKNDPRLVNQWEFYRNAEDQSPSLVTPWTDYKPYGDILLSSGRGENMGNLTDIAVYEEVPDSTFVTLSPVSLD